MAYQRGVDGAHHAFGVAVLTLTSAGIARITVFGEASLAARFGLPPIQLSARPPRTHEERTSMDLLKALAQTFDHTTEVLQRVTPDQLGLPTPCAEWDVGTVISHLTSVVVNMGRAARGNKPLPDANPVALETDLGTQFRGHADRTLMAWRARGLDGEIDIDDQGCTCQGCRSPPSTGRRAAQ